MTEIKEKRKVRGYKVADYYYNKAMKRSKREKLPLANLIENVVQAFANGYDIKVLASVSSSNKPAKK